MSTRRAATASCGIIMSLAIGACADEPCRALVVRGVLLPPPESLAMVAEQVRDGGGRVLVGAVGSVAALPPGRIDIGDGYAVEYPRRGAIAAVIDDLGAPAIAPEFSFCGAAGRAALTDASGCATDELVVEDIEAPFPWTYVPISTEPRVLFVVPDRDCGWELRWQAALEGGLVESIGTASGESVPVDSLRLAP